MHRVLLTGLAAFTAVAVWSPAAAAALFSATGPIIAIIAGDLFVGEAEGRLNGSGTFGIQSRSRSAVACRGQFATTAELSGSGDMRCSDGATATFQFQRLSLMRGHGTGNTSRGSMSFTYGLSANESEPYLKLPPGKALRLVGKQVVIVDERQQPAPIPLTGASATETEVAPDLLLSAATLMVTDNLKQERNQPAITPGKITELVESTILPLFDLRHMTRLAVARNWRFASPEQQNALVAEFRAMLARSYSSALANYRDHAIEYKPLRIAPGETAVTVKSTWKRPGAERMAINYDMEKTATGWKIYDIKIAGVSLITTYRSSFAAMINDSGVEGLINTLAAGNRQADSGIKITNSGARHFLFIFAVMPSIVASGR